MIKVIASKESKTELEYLFEDLDTALKFVMKIEFKGYSTKLERL